MTNDVKKGKNSKSIISGKDYTTIGEISNVSEEEYGNYFEIVRNQYPKRTSPLNLGLYVRNSTAPELYSHCYVGVMPLVKKNGEKAEGDIVIKIKPRFGANAVEMLKFVMQSEDFFEISDRIRFDSKPMRKWEGNEEDILYGVINDLPSVELSQYGQGTENDLGFAELCGLFEMMEFIQYTKDVCRKMLKQQSGKIEENLTGKIKGKINIQKQIKYNLSKGREDRIYCSYNKMSVDTIENRILKYALYLVECKLRDYPDLMVDDFAYCKRALTPVTLVKCTNADFRGLKNNGVFCYYKNAINSAKKIISRISVDYSGSEPKVALSHTVQPFFVRMDLLFELYCRALICEAIKDTDLKLRPYKQECKIFENEQAVPAGFAKVKIPDIVIEGVDGKGKAWMVLDAKYADASNGVANRDRTFQILSYMFLLNCKYGGFIFPKEDEDKGEKLASQPQQIKIENSDKERYGYSIEVETALSGKKEDIQKIVAYLSKKLQDINKEKEE